MDLADALAHILARPLRPNDRLHDFMRAMAMGVADAEPAGPRYASPVPIAPGHDHDAFDCGKPPLGGRLKTRALDGEGRASRTYVVTATSGVSLGGMHGRHGHNQPNH